MKNMESGEWDQQEAAREPEKTDHETFDTIALAKIQEIQTEGAKQLNDSKYKDGASQNEILMKIHDDIEAAKQESRDRAKTK